LISIDSSGWIEYFTKGPKAAQYKLVIEAAKPETIVTSVVVLYEVYKKIKKVKGEEEALLAVAALSQTNIVPVDQTISLEAAENRTTPFCSPKSDVSTSNPTIALAPKATARAFARSMAPVSAKPAVPRLAAPIFC